MMLAYVFNIFFRDTAILSSRLLFFFSTTINIQSKSNKMMLKVYQPIALPIRQKKSAENSSIKEVTHTKKTEIATRSIAKLL